VGEQQNPSAPGASETADDGFPGAWGCVLEAHHAGWRFHELDLASERLQASGNEIGDAAQPFDVGAPRLDGDEIPKRLEVCLPFALDARQHRVCGLREHPGGEQRDERDDERTYRKSAAGQG
jgi:hypothetical protein